MEKFFGKTEAEAVKNACEAMGVTEDELFYTVTFEKKTFFTKKVEIEAYCMKSVEKFIVDYLTKILSGMQLDNEVTTQMVDGRIMVNIDSSNNSILIGKGGVILGAFNTLVKTAVSNTFKKRIELSVDINGYKQDRYKKVASMAHRIGRSVQKSRQSAKLDPMPADERKVVHQALANMNYVRTESTGEGRNRYLTIIYDANKKKKTNTEVTE